MPKARILLFGPAPRRMDPAKALEMLRTADLPGLTKCVLTDRKFDTEKAAKTFNIEADYSPEPVQLETLAAWAGAGDARGEQLADAMELFALRAIIARDGPFDFAILQRSPADLNARWPEQKEALGGEPFLALGEGNVLFDLRGKLGALFLDYLWNLYSSGAVFGLEDYAFEAALQIAVDAMKLERDLIGQKSPARAEPVDA